MTKSIKRTSIAILAVVQGTAAHMRMELPRAFGELLSNHRPNAPHPLGKHADLPDEPILFPCQMGADYKYDFSNRTTVRAGDSTLVSFIGEIVGGVHTSAAVHGGGSCQFSISKTASGDPKDWKVIKTFIGGCPATAETNIAQWKQCQTPDSDETECVKKYKIPIPKEVPSGEYFFGWTWFNKMGNREMYMQCAPIEVTDGGNDGEFLDTLPSIFMANCDESVGCRDFCTMAEGTGVVDIPNPGLNVKVSTLDTDKQPSYMFEPCLKLYGDAAKAPNYPGKGSGSGALPNVGAMPAPPPSANQPVSFPVVSPAPSQDNLYTGKITATSAITSYVTAPVVAAPSASSAAPIALPDSGSCAAGEVPCTVSGFVCVSETQFGLCNRGCMVPQAVAAGTVCKNGGIQYAGAVKRGDKHETVRV